MDILPAILSSFTSRLKRFKHDDLDIALNEKDKINYEIESPSGTPMSECSSLISERNRYESDEDTLLSHPGGDDVETNSESSSFSASPISPFDCENANGCQVSSLKDNKSCDGEDEDDDDATKLRDIDEDCESIIFPSSRCVVKVMPMKGRVSKTFANTLIGRSAFNKEIQMYARLAQIPKVRLAIPQCLQIQESERSIIYKYCGEDTLTLSQTHKMQMDSMDSIRRCLKQMVPVISEMHSHYLYHGDIKPDNIVDDGQQYRLIDFDMSTFVPQFRVMQRSFTGTIPYVSPFRFEHENIDMRDCLRWNDYYGFAMTILYFLGSRETKRVRGKECCVVPIAQLRYAFATGRLHDPIYKTVYPYKPRYAPLDYDSNFVGADVPVMKALAGLILSQIDHSFDLLVWENHDKRYYENHDASIVFSSLVRMDAIQLESPDFYWGQLVEQLGFLDT